LKLLKGKRMDPAIAAGRLGLSGVRTSPCRAGERRAGFGGAVSGSLTLSGGGSTSGPCGRKKVSVRWAGFALSGARTAVTDRSSHVRRARGKITRAPAGNPSRPLGTGTARLVSSAPPASRGLGRTTSRVGDVDEMVSFAPS
jgi:hypothetical protein